MIPTRTSSRHGGEHSRLGDSEHRRLQRVPQLGDPRIREARHYVGIGGIGQGGLNHGADRGGHVLIRLDGRGTTAAGDHLHLDSHVVSEGTHGILDLQGDVLRVVRVDHADSSEHGDTLPLHTDHDSQDPHRAPTESAPGTPGDRRQKRSGAKGVRSTSGVRSSANWASTRPMSGPAVRPMWG